MGILSSLLGAGREGEVGGGGGETEGKRKKMKKK